MPIWLVVIGSAVALVAVFAYILRWATYVSVEELAQKPTLKNQSDTSNRLVKASIVFGIVALALILSAFFINR